MSKNKETAGSEQIDVGNDEVRSYGWYTIT
jgi:hypothetical protein